MTDIDIKEDDYWVFTTNQGNIPRLVTLVGSKYVSYRNAAGHERVCLISTFKRWAKGAELEYRHPKYSV
nr:hypothetical protein 5 [Gammaproteobacteria bacterium]